MKSLVFMQLLPAAQLHLQLSGREVRLEVKCQYAVGQISQPDETQE